MTSQLGQVGEKMANMGFSRKQESQADMYGYQFLKDSNVNPWYLASAFERLIAISESATDDNSLIKKLFSSHPDLQKRVDDISKKATADGFAKPKDL